MSTKNQEYNQFSSQGSPFTIGRVKKVVLNVDDLDYESEYDVGKIYFEILFQSKGTPKGISTSTPAYPIFKFFKQYPLREEIVMIVTGPSYKLNEDVNSKSLYYFPPFSLWGSVNHNAMPSAFSYVDFLNDKLASVAKGDDNFEYPLGDFFQEKNIKSLKNFEGDVIIEGRFGQSIRFGSNHSAYSTENNWSFAKENGKPITIIRNGQGNVPINSKNPKARQPWAPTVEDINYDDSSIYLTSGQGIVIEDINNFPLDSFGKSIDVQLNNVTTAIDATFVSNETDSAKNQDEKSLNNGQ